MQKIKLSIFAIAIGLSLCGAVVPASAQTTNAGKLDAWTTRPVGRLHESSEHTYIRVVRAAKQRGYDRIVLEFVGPVPNYSVQYLPSRFYDYDSGRRRIKIAGKSFVHVNLNMIPIDEQQLKFTQANDFAPNGRLRLPALLEVEQAGFFEGHYDFLLGLKSRRVFRVTELANPARLVIDFRH